MESLPFPPALLTAFAMLALLFLVTGLTRPRGVDPDQARELVEQGALLVDVRTPQEYEQHHIPGALNLPLQELDNRISELPEDQDIVLYCRSGARSGRALQRLQSLGYSDVYDLGSISRWPARP